MSYFKFYSIVNGCAISYYDSQLRINQSVISFKYDITNLVVSKSKIFVLYNKDGCNFDELPRNNIVAYDFNGQYLYDIGHIIQEDWPFSNIKIYNASTINQEPLTDTLKFISDHEYLVCYTFGALRYILDITNGELVQKVSGRFQ